MMFEHYKSLKLEQQRLNDIMESLLAERESLGDNIIVDSVEGSEAEYPYIKRTISIEGFETSKEKVQSYLLNVEIKHVRKQQI